MRKTVCIQGLGFVGAAMAAATARARNGRGEALYDVIGVDLPTPSGAQRVDALNRGQFPFVTSDPSLEDAVGKAVAEGNLHATTDPAVYADADIIIVDVHLDIPFRAEEPQLEFKDFVDAVRTVGSRMREDALVIVETTVPPGTCAKIVVPTLSEEFARRGLDPGQLKLAHSYERVMPGKDYLDSIVNFWRVFSGHTSAAADACEAFLSTVINVAAYPLTRLTSTTASETAKVLENTYRAVNIAFIHEWTQYAERVGIDLFEVIEAIRKRPTHANIRYPGLGIGGYCLTKDPTFTGAAASQLFHLDLDFPFSKLAVSAAASMPQHTVQRLIALLGGSVVSKRVLVCGVSYREDVADTRFSPSETVYHALTEFGAHVDVHDPLVTFWEEMNIPVPAHLPAPNDYAVVLFATRHSCYKSLNLAEWIIDKETTQVLDAVNVFSAEQRRRFRKLGVRIESIGVGDGL